MFEKIAVELYTGEVLIGYKVEPTERAPEFLHEIGHGIFLQREHTVSFLAAETIKEVRVARDGEKEK